MERVQTVSQAQFEPGIKISKKTSEIANSSTTISRSESILDPIHNPVNAATNAHFLRSVGDRLALARVTLHHLPAVWLRNVGVHFMQLWLRVQRIMQDSSDPAADRPPCSKQTLQACITALAATSTAGTLTLSAQVGFLNHAPLMSFLAHHVGFSWPCVCRNSVTSILTTYLTTLYPAFRGSQP